MLDQSRALIQLGGQMLVEQRLLTPSALTGRYICGRQRKCPVTWSFRGDSIRQSTRTMSRETFQRPSRSSSSGMWCVLIALVVEAGNTSKTPVDVTDYTTKLHRKQSSVRSKTSSSFCNVSIRQNLTPPPRHPHHVQARSAAPIQRVPTARPRVWGWPLASA
jgi:hypothetical protein